MQLLATFAFLNGIGHSLREAFYMFWESLWALVLGFSLSGIVQSFVSRDKMRQRLGNHRSAAVARASAYGVVSSSCSYAASAMAKSLFSKGADFTAAMIFMIASTNLVVELGVVLVVLLGWQFAVGEFVGGPIMIVLIALFGGLVFTQPLLDAARRRLNIGQEHAHDDRHLQIAELQSQSDVKAEYVPVERTNRAALVDAAQYAISDVTMLRKELAIGYLVAGFLAALVPVHFWNSLFLHGHGNWTTIENAAVGPIVAVISWVCSIGNVPLAAALWNGGISFGGVIAFIFADLISMPLILVYRRLYGWPLTLRIVALFYPVMAVSGLATEELFGVFYHVPVHTGAKAMTAHFAWNYTTFLDFAFILVAILVWWLAGNRHRYGGGAAYAIDPVCGMQVETANAPAHTSYEDTSYYFCSDRCKDRFARAPQRFLDSDSQRSSSSIAQDTDLGNQGKPPEPTTIDPVCHMSVDPDNAAAHRSYKGMDYWFCNTGCARSFDEDPKRYLPASIEHPAS